MLTPASALRFACCALLLTACAADPLGSDAAPAPAQRAEPIINGDSCDAATHPTAVGIIIDAQITSPFGDGPITALSCTGTLIAPDVVLTAAHCLDPSLLTMGFGEATDVHYYVSFQPDLAALADGSSTTLPDDAIEARDWIANDNFDIDELNATVDGPGEFSDIGLIFLDSPVQDIDPVLVIGADEVDQLTEGAEVAIAGWGQQTQTSNPFEPPPAGSIGLKICGDSTINELGDAEMQIGGNDSTTRKCHGDSGGPTYFNVDTPHDQSLRVIGVTSHAYDQEDCAKGGVDTRVDAHLAWIDDQMSSRCADESRAWCEEPGLLPLDYYDIDGPGGAGRGCDKSGCNKDGNEDGAANPFGGSLLLPAVAGLWLRRRVRLPLE